MSPKVLLVYATPTITAAPVPPYGMERVAQCFAMAGCAVTLLAPFIEPDPLAALTAHLVAKPDLVAFSIRNVDDALIVRSELGPGDVDITFYLDDVRPLVQAAIAAVGMDRVVLGGTALSAGPAPVLRYLGARVGIRGPADDLVWRLGRALVRGEGPALPSDPRVVRLDGTDPAGKGELLPHQSPGPRRGAAAEWRAPPGATPRMGPFLGLTLARGSRVPVSVITGCDRRCHFCVEARYSGYQTLPRPVDEILSEVDALAGVGARRLWLACSELNVAPKRWMLQLLAGLAKRDVDVQFFVQPAPMDHEILDAMELAGVNPTELSFELGHLDDRILRAGGGPTNRKSIDKLVELWLARGYDELGGSVLLGAHPLETESTLRAAMKAALDIDRALPRGFGLAYATGGRVYPESDLADWVAADWARHRPHLYTLDGEPPDPSFVRPVIYCRPQSPRRLTVWVKDVLAGAKGKMMPMNAEAAAGAAEIAAEAEVNRGIWRIHEDQPEAARRCFERAIEHQPGHLEALAQLSLLLANQVGDTGGARSALLRLLDALPSEDARRREVNQALADLPE